MINLYIYFLVMKENIWTTEYLPIKINASKDSVPSNAVELINSPKFVHYFREYMQKALFHLFQNNSASKNLNIDFIKWLSEELEKDYAKTLSLLLNNEEVSLEDLKKLQEVINSINTEESHIKNKFSINWRLEEEKLHVFDHQKIKTELLNMIWQRMHEMQKTQLQNDLFNKYNIEVDIDNPLQKFDFITVDRKDTASFYKDKSENLLFLYFDKDYKLLQFRNILGAKNIQYIYGNFVIDDWWENKTIFIKEWEKYQSYTASDFYVFSVDEISDKKRNYSIEKYKKTDDFAPSFALIYVWNQKYILDLRDGKKIPIVKRTKQMSFYSKDKMHKFDTETSARGNTATIYALPVEDKSWVYFLKYNHNRVNTSH